MSESRTLDGLRLSSVFLVALALSIGWGIRGNFGHEYGAMIAGLLAAVAACLVSNRADWRARIPYFAFFGALGWAFGGSISYMQVISYTHSGHLPSVIYGFFGLFLIGFLWAGMGGAGTAFPAVANRDQLTAIFRPLLWVFGGWIILAIVYPLFESWESAHDATWQRHAGVLYWYDADWYKAASALLALFCFDLWDRRLPHARTKVVVTAAVLGALAGAAAVYFGLVIGIGPEAWQPYTSYAIAAVVLGALFAGVGYVLSRSALTHVIAYGAAGAIIGFALQAFYRLTGISTIMWKALVWYQVDMDYARAQAKLDGIPLEKKLEEFVINWPQFMQEMPDHIGWVVGLILGVCLYFYRFGKFRSGASLFVHQAGGWLLMFILLPTLLGLGGAGFRLTPPRSDDWAGILGVLIGTWIWLYRNRLIPVLYASLVSGIIGGLGFSGAAFIKLMMMVPGNRYLNPDNTDLVSSWQHWQSANWHSFLEQTYGFINGIAIAVALGLLARMKGRVDEDRKQRPWTTIFAAAFAFFGVLYLNAAKNPVEWIKTGVVPEEMTLPLAKRIALDAIPNIDLPAIGLTFSASTWFTLIFAAITLAGTAIMIRHRRHPIAALPDTWLGRGQLLFIAFLWAIVIINFERALPNFRDNRLLTEGVITLNAALATWLILVVPGKDLRVPRVGLMNYENNFIRGAVALLLALIMTGAGMTYGVRHLYGDTQATHESTIKKRFGPDAEWRIAPLEKGKDHS